VITYLIAIAGSFAIGSIPMGVLVGCVKGVNVRTSGSGNIGATNVARTMGKKTGALVLALDAAKGALPVGAIFWLQPPSQTSDWLISAAGLAAIAGHCFTPWLRFLGGKGVATSLGVFAVCAPISTALAALVWLGVYASSRIASLASLTAVALMPAMLWAMERATPLIALAGCAAAIITIRHTGNIKRLLAREELKA